MIYVFYLHVFKNFARGLWMAVRGTEEKWAIVGWITSMICVVFAVSWKTINPAWALVPLGIALLVALMRAVYQTALEQKWTGNVLPKFEILKGYSSLTIIPESDGMLKWKIKVTLNTLPRDSVTLHTAKSSVTILVEDTTREWTFRRECDGWTDFKSIPEHKDNSKFHVRIDKSCRVVIGAELSGTAGDLLPPNHGDFQDEIFVVFHIGCDEVAGRIVEMKIPFKRSNNDASEPWIAGVDRAEISEINASQ